MQRETPPNGPGRARYRCVVCRSALRISTTPWICRPSMVRRSMPATGRALDAVAVTLARCAGGVVLGKTVTTEFASLVLRRRAIQEHFAHTPGGSSSGSAGRGRCCDVAHRVRQPDGRLSHPSRLVLRRRRVCAVLPAHPYGGHEMLRVAPRYGGSVCRECRRCRLRGNGNHRAAASR